MSTSPSKPAAASPANQPSPLPFFQAANAFHLTEAVKSALELDMFTAIAEGSNTAAALAQRCQVAERGARILCDYLTINGFLTKQNNQYGLTLDSATFLNRKSPAYMGDAVQFLASPHQKRGFELLTEAVRRGGTAIDDQGSTAPEHPMWVSFARAMAPLMAMPAEGIARVLQADTAPAWKVLDIAAGHGVFGITLARHNKNARIVALDWQNVLQVALENAQKAGISDRYSTIAGSAFDVDLGKDYDVVLLTNFLHHFDPGTCEKLLRKIHGALKAGGRVVTVEFVPNDDRVTPPESAGFSLIMLAGTPKGDAYTRRELEQMFKNAGFSSTELHATPGAPFSILVTV